MIKKQIACFMFAMLFLLSACGTTRNFGIYSPNDFTNSKIAVQASTTAADSIYKMVADGQNIEVYPYNKITKCFDDLLLGRVDAVYTDTVVASYYTLGSDQYDRTWISDVSEPIGICLQKSSEDLKTAIEAALDLMNYDGRITEISIKHFGEATTFSGFERVGERPDIPDNFQTLVDGTLTVGIEIGYPPMEYTAADDMTYAGFDVDIAREIGEILGLEVEFVDTEWENIFTNLENNKYDCIISSVSITPEREEKYLMTKPYVANSLCIVVKNDDVEIDNLFADVLGG